MNIQEYRTVRMQELHEMIFSVNFILFQKMNNSMTTDRVMVTFSMFNYSCMMSDVVDM